MKKLAKKLYDEVISTGRSFQERLFIILTWLAEIAVVLGLICDFIIGESIVETLSLLIAAVLTPFVVIFAVRKNKTDLMALVVAMSIVFILLPISYFYGGGLTGGSNVWIVVSFLYIGLLLKSVPRKIMMIMLTLLTVAEYTLEFWCPELTVQHTRPVWYADSAVSVLLVGFLVYAVVYIMTKIFQWENARAVEQAKKIEELNKAQSRFFSSMSHEIRTPINTIIGLNEMILREDISDEVADDARNVRSASKILLSLINDILDMSKIESGKMDIVIQPYDVGAMFSDIVNMIWIRASEKGLKFSIDVDPALPSSLVSDEVRIKQILINLLNNAVKYTEEGSVTLSIHCQKTKPNKVLVTYSVEDTGIGIRKESIPLLFDAFRREDQKKTRYIEGTGLGLSIVKQLADLLGGDVSVNSIYT
nr:fatty acid-binding protein DegV [Lachnospiraceae bacterium]